MKESRRRSRRPPSASRTFKAKFSSENSAGVRSSVERVRTTKKMVMLAALGVDATRLYSSAKTKKFSDFLPKIGLQLQLATCFRPGETDLLKLLKAGCTNISAGDGLGNVIFEDVVTFRIFYIFDTTKNVGEEIS